MSATLTKRTKSPTSELDYAETFANRESVFALLNERIAIMERFKAHAKAPETAPFCERRIALYSELRANLLSGEFSPAAVLALIPR